jgi:hypothetical protein
MQLNRYSLISSESLHTFEFISEGPRGSIHKVITLQATEVTNVYNLAFGDKNHLTGKMDDQSVTHNNDTLRVLSTVAFAVIVFTNQFPHVSIYVEGSTAARTRLYQMGISKFHQELTHDFILLGLKDERWEVFQLNKNYECFVVKRKPSNKLPL